MDSRTSSRTDSVIGLRVETKASEARVVLQEQPPPAGNTQSLTASTLSQNNYEHIYNMAQSLNLF